MVDVLTPPPQPPPEKPEPALQNLVVVKKYANRRLYNTETSSYITLENLADMIRAGRDFVVYDAKSGDDITRGVLTQIIVEEESKGSAMLPTAFLRQLIGFYGGSLEGVVPRYLEYSMSSFARQQQQVRTVMERTFSPFMPAGVEEMNRHNMALFERAMSMWNPFARTGRDGSRAGCRDRRREAGAGGDEGGLCGQSGAGLVAQRGREFAAATGGGASQGGVGRPHAAPVADKGAPGRCRARSGRCGRWGASCPTHR